MPRWIERLFRLDQWRPCHPWFRKTLIDGTVSSGPLMVRRVNGQAQYRAMTWQEEFDYSNTSAY